MKVSIQRRDHQKQDRNGDVTISIPLDISYGFDLIPQVDLGKVKSYSGRRRVCKRRDGTFVMYQQICVEIPFDIDVEIECPNHLSNNNDIVKE